MRLERSAQVVVPVECDSRRLIDIMVCLRKGPFLRPKRWANRESEKILLANVDGTYSISGVDGWEVSADCSHASGAPCENTDFAVLGNLGCFVGLL